MNTHFPKLPKNPTEAGFREMQVYELVRQAADCWNIPLEQIAKFQEWWDSGKKNEIAEKIAEEFKLSEPFQPTYNPFSHRFSQFYKHHTSYTLPEEKGIPSVINLLDIANYYLSSSEITIPHFVINIDSQNLYDIAELGESVLVLAGGKEANEKILEKTSKKISGKSIVDYLKKIQLLVEGLQLVTPKSLPDLYISNSITVKFSLDIPVKCRNLILAKKVKIQGIRFMPTQMQVMGGI